MVQAEVGGSGAGLRGMGRWMILRRRYGRHGRGQEHSTSFSFCLFLLLLLLFVLFILMVEIMGLYYFVCK